MVRSCALGLAAAIAAAGCLKSAAYQCASSTECTRDGVSGVCEPVGFCSFADPSCGSGRRFADLSGAHANQCVGDGSDGGVDSAVDGGAIDAPPGSPVKCAASLTCPTGTSFCCLDRTTGAGSCQPLAGSCTMQRVMCDDAGDCGGGSAVCCARYQNVSGLQGATCQASSAACTPSMMGFVELWCDPAAAAPCPGAMTCTGTPSAMTPGFKTCE